MTPIDVVIREAGIDDIPQILYHRSGMYEDMGVGNPQSRSEMMAAAAKVLPQAIRDGSFRGWLAEVDGQVVAGGGVFITPWLTHPGDLMCRRATILNVYTNPQYRRRGIALKLMETIVTWCRAQGFANVFLHASHQGRPLYEKLGFQSGNEMRLKLH